MSVTARPGTGDSEAAPEKGPGVTAIGLRSALGQVALPAWFVWIGVVYPAFHARTLAIDARLYQQATNAWLTDGDPWALAAGGTPYAAAPWSLLTYLPTAWLPVEVAAWTWMVMGFVAALWILHRLKMPLWWLAFPPLAQALWNGNAQPLVLAALLVRAPLGVTVAGALKLYGFVPAIFARRWRELAIAALFLAVTLLVLPWGLYVEHGFALDAIAGHTWNGSAWRFPPLIPLALGALWVLRNRGAEWFAIPALWPGTQTLYHVFALPALAGRPWLAAALALPVPLLAPVAVIGYALLSLRAAPRAWRSRPWRPG